MDSLMPTSMNSLVLHGPKPFSVCKWAKHRPKPPKPIQCNYFTASGNAATECLDYQSRKWKMEAVYTRMQQGEVHVSRLEFNPRRPFESFLRRNVRSGRDNVKTDRLKLKQFISRLEAEPAMVSTEKFARDATFRQHLILYHGHAEPDENQLDVSPLRQRPAAIPENRIQDLQNGTGQSYGRNDSQFDEMPCSSKDAYANRPRSFERLSHRSAKENRQKVAPYPFNETTPIDRTQTHTFAHESRFEVSPLRQRSNALPERQILDLQSGFERGYGRNDTQLTELPCSSRDAYSNRPRSYERVARPSAHENRQEVAICRVDGTGPIVRSQKVLPRNDDTTRSIKFAEATRLFDMGDDSAIDEALNNSTHADYADIRTRDGLMRSFYVIFLHHQAPLDPKEPRNTAARRKFAHSALVTANITNPPINGIEFREYDDDEYEALDPYAKECLRGWSRFLNPVLLPPGSNDESGFEDSVPLRNWNWCVRQAKRNRHRSRLHTAGSSANSAIVEHPEDGIANRSHERRQTVYAESNGDVVMEEVTERVIERRTRRITSKRPHTEYGNVVIEPVDEESEESPSKRSGVAPDSVPDLDTTIPTPNGPASKRPNPFVTPTPKRRGRPPKVKVPDESGVAESFQSPPKKTTPKPKGTPKTPKMVTPRTIPMGNSPSPLRRTPRSVKAICYKE
uniref:Ulp1 protease family protein n=1 Tax=Panagrellus redivivus TaxID=6233 RepID=A0A7E4W8D3_PANRE